MRFGICVGGKADNIKIAAAAGADYIESCFSLLAEADDEKFAKFKAELEANNIRCESVNCFLPGRLKVTGEEADFEALREYIEKGFSRAAEIGVVTVVFGSSGARNVPEGFSYGEAYRQLIDFLKTVVTPLCEKYGITVTLEPLGPDDSNILNSAQEGAAIVAAVNTEPVKLLVDLYHMANKADTPADVRKLKGLIRHSHIAEPITRNYPTDGAAYDYADFIAALEETGCTRCSVEARTDEFEKDCFGAMKLLKSL